ncbi:MAG: MBL fold metallo-hydrolase [Spirochaetes bacterium]|jgi:glyoxylase-like metal-dependent hydrolase (beta-lactamase superfamily II)|nr:MBL fold metallo-hydrolase [Spirochaetota bacterium]
MVERIVVGPLHTNTYVVSTGRKECILVDPGDEAQTIYRRLTALNMVPQAILLTHGHLDHTAAALAVREYYDHDIQIAIHKKDADLLLPDSFERHKKMFESLGPDGLETFERLYVALPPPDFYLEEGSSIMETDLSVIHTPGHTAGSVSLYSEQDEALFSGDTLLFKAVGPTEGEDSDHAALIDSIMKKIFELPDSTRLYPGHGPNSTLEREKRNNIALRNEGVI